MSTAFHPETDGQSERANRTIEEMLRHYVHPLHDDWDRYLPVLKFAHNNSVQPLYTPHSVLSQFWSSPAYCSFLRSGFARARRR